MFNNLDSELNRKDKFTCMGSMDHPVWWDEKTVVTYVPYGRIDIL
jgi:hypothetical protein